MDKTMANKLMSIPNDDTQNFLFIYIPPPSPTKLLLKLLKLYSGAGVRQNLIIRWVKIVCTPLVSSNYIFVSQAIKFILINISLFFIIPD